MRTMALGWLAIRWLAFGWLAVSTSAAWAQDWKAGASRVMITPENLMWMAGYGARDKPAEGKLTELWAKALVLEDAAGKRAVLVTMDLVGIDRDFSDRICRQLLAKYEIQRADVALCVSHTHCGPVVARNLAPLHYLLVDARQQQLINEYAELLEQKLVGVVGEALDKLAPARLSWGSGRASFAVNRRDNPAPKVLALRETGQLRGPSDHDVPVLAAQDIQGRLIAVAFGYACHATTLSFYQWCGDYPGFAQSALEENHPDCVALFWAGCGADQNPLPRGTVELAKHYGQRLAIAVDEVLLTTRLQDLPPRLSTAYREVDLPLDELPTRKQLEDDAKSTNKYTAARAKMLLAKLDSGESLPATYPYPVGVWSIGDEVQFITLGGEVVVDYAFRLKSEFSGVKTWVAGYSHDVMAYIPSRRVLQEGGYEGGGAMVYYGLPASWSPAVEETVIRGVRDQLPRK